MIANRTIVERYLDCLRGADASGIDLLFTPKAIVLSPLYGERSARAFFEELFSITSESEIRLIDVFEQSSSGDRFAAYFRYNWTLANGERAELECVDLFRVERRPSKNWFWQRRSGPDTRIAELRIIYDTHGTRPKHDRAKGDS